MCVIVTITIASWNVDGLARLLADGALGRAIEALGRPEVMCLQEVRIRASDAAAIDALASAVPRLRDARLARS